MDPPPRESPRGKLVLVSRPAMLTLDARRASHCQFFSATKHDVGCDWGRRLENDSDGLEDAVRGCVGGGGGMS